MRNKFNVENEYLKLPDYIRVFVDAIRGRKEFPERLAKMSAILKDKNEMNEARLIAKWAMRISPHSPRVRYHAYWVMREQIPLWHFNIVNDAERNLIYEKALKKFVKPGMHVLEIGTGTGILAMMAARAGARLVTTCEKEEMIAKAARKIIAANGFQDRITVMAKEFETVKAGADLQEPVDLLVSEIVDNSLLGERVIPLISYAKTNLLKPDAVILPGMGAVRGVLAGDVPQVNSYRLENISGFDLSEFNRFYPPRINVRKAILEEVGYCDTVELFRLDFQNGAGFDLREQTLDIQIHRDGLVDGFLHWLWIHFTDDLIIENHPERRCATWCPQFHLFRRPIPVHKGQYLKIRVSFEEDQFFIEPLDSLQNASYL